MRMREMDFEAQPPIDAYGEGGFRVGGERHEGGVAVTADGVAHWPVSAPSEMDEAAFAPFLETKAGIDVLVVGTGEDIAALPRAARAALDAAGVGVEAMATGPACRTYNVLLAEDRRVAVALIAV